MRLGRVPGVAGPTSPNNAGRGAHDEPGPSASVLHMSAFRPPADLRGRAPGRREEPGPGTRARKRMQSWDRPRAGPGKERCPVAHTGSRAGVSSGTGRCPPTSEQGAQRTPPARRAPRPPAPGARRTARPWAGTAMGWASRPGTKPSTCRGRSHVRLLTGVPAGGVTERLAGGDDSGTCFPGRNRQRSGKRRGARHPRDACPRSEPRGLQTAVGARGVLSRSGSGKVLG